MAIRASVTVTTMALLLAAPAWAGRPPGGANYGGTTSQGNGIALHVTGDRRGLQMTFKTLASCNRGPDKVSQAVFKHDRPTIRPDGTFRFHRTYHLGPVPGFAQRHTERQTITGAFGAGARTVHGSVRMTDVGADGLRCTTRLTFSARRAG
jgi:hypothetical protein